MGGDMDNSDIDPDVMQEALDNNPPPAPEPAYEPTVCDVIETAIDNAIVSVGGLFDSED